MRGSNYRVNLVDGKRVIMLIATTFAVISVMLFGQGMSKGVAKNIDVSWLKILFCQTLPLSQNYINPKIDMGISYSQAFLGFDVNQPLTIISNQIAVVSAATQNTIEETEHNDVVPVPKATATATATKGKRIEEIMINPQSSKGYISADGVYIKNDTTYNIDVEKLLNEKLSFKIAKGAPQVLIVHTHTSEAFTPSGKDYYEPTDPDRTEDNNFNVVRVGNEMADILNSKGIETLHDTTLHDYPSYNGSYKNCLLTVQRNLKDYPSIKIVLDIHRDGMTTSDGTKLKVCTTIENKKTAQVMILCGTDNSGLNHPNWRENFKLALKMQAKMNELYPTLARPLSLVKERYNMNTTNGSLLIEVGSNGNTLEEAVNGGYYSALAIAELLKTL